LKRTPLYHKHVELGAKMIDFSGWEMPVQYESILEEHITVRKSVGMFDISHMGEIKIQGKGAKKTVLYLTPVHEQKLVPKRASYSFLLNENGGVIDDLIIYTFSEETFILVVNAGNIEKDFNWIKENALSETRVENISENISAISIQGPHSTRISESLFSLELSNMKYYSFETNLEYRGSKILFLSRTGYTGELGFEIYTRPEDVENLWDELLTLRVKPCGLGARDGLRLEAGMPLYGHELNEDITPLEANLRKFLDMERNFIGKKALIERVVEKRLVGFKMIDKGVPRKEQKIIYQGQEVGYVTSGGYSPYLNEYIGMGYVKNNGIESEINIDMRGKEKRAVITALPFYRKG